MAPAGRDTTATTVTFVIYLLAMYPAVMTRLRTEILDKVGQSRRPNYDDIKAMKYLRAVINGRRSPLPSRYFARARLIGCMRTETLRLFPVVYVYIPTSIEAYGKYRNYSS